MIINLCFRELIKRQYHRLSRYRHLPGGLKSVFHPLISPDGRRWTTLQIFLLNYTWTSSMYRSKCTHVHMNTCTLAHTHTYTKYKRKLIYITSDVFYQREKFTNVSPLRKWKYYPGFHSFTVNVYSFIFKIIILSHHFHHSFHSTQVFSHTPHALFQINILFFKSIVVTCICAYIGMYIVRGHVREPKDSTGTLGTWLCGWQSIPEWALKRQSPNNYALWELHIVI